MTAMRGAAPMSVVEAEPLLSVVLPTFNERTNVPILYDRIVRALTGVPFELIFVDDDSPDGTSDAVHALGSTDRRVRCITRVGRRGLAGACVEGILSAQASVVAVMDADLQHDEAVLPLMLDRMTTSECDIVVASRYIESPTSASMSSIRGRLSGLGTRLARKMLRITISDPMSGFFMVRRSVVQDLAPRLATGGFKILADILVTGAGQLQVAEVPYTFGPRLHGESKLDELVLFDFCILIATRATGNIVPIRFVAFILVGSFGLLVHLTILRVALAVFADRFLPAQTLATLGAMVTNFFLNNTLTYRDQRIRGLKLVRGLVVFCAICAVGAFNNVAFAVWLYDRYPIWWLAAAAGTLAGAVWNYVFSAALVWRRR